LGTGLHVDVTRNGRGTGSATGYGEVPNEGELTLFGLRVERKVFGMSPTITETAEAFSRHRFEDTYPFILDEAEWALVGGEQIRGKTDIVRVCAETAHELENATTSFSRFKVITTDDCVVIDSRAEYIDADGESSHVASCDIFEFVDGNIAAITSYAAEIEPSPTG
jgi:hypothetical protein